MVRTTISRSDFRAILKQAQREQEACEAGFTTHEEMVEAHRRDRQDALKRRRDAVRSSNLERAFGVI
jgi:hypothetical protein